MQGLALGFGGKKRGEAVKEGHYIYTYLGRYNLQVHYTYLPTYLEGEHSYDAIILLTVPRL